MRPAIELLSTNQINRILDEAFQLLLDPGVKVQSAEARQLLVAAGALADEQTEIVHIPESVVRRGLSGVPKSFSLYDRAGNPAVFYGANAVHFDPGSSGVHILDPDTLEHRPSQTPDLVRLVKIAESLPQFAAQSTACVCHEVPESIGDLYRLYIVLLYSRKPVVTGAFSVATLKDMFEMLGVFSSGKTHLATKPQAIFDVCPSPPLNWSHFASQNLIILARAGVPAQIVSMPLAGATAPVTLIGAVVQHAAECLSGIAIHQLAASGAPIVWGGAPTIFDMRRGTTPMGAIETAMIDAAYAHVGKSLGLPTHAYLCASDSKTVDAQAGLESGMTALIGALAGINMISGAGMLDFLACLSPEKLVIDAEAIAMIQRLLAGIQENTPTLATELFAGVDLRSGFLKHRLTRQLFSKEHLLPSEVIDRTSIRNWQEGGRLDAFRRAQLRAARLLEEYQAPDYPPEQIRALRDLVLKLAQSAGMSRLPELDLPI